MVVRKMAGEARKSIVGLMYGPLRAVGIVADDQWWLPIPREVLGDLPRFTVVSGFRQFAKPSEILRNPDNILAIIPMQCATQSLASLLA